MSLFFLFIISLLVVHFERKGVLRYALVVVIRGEGGCRRRGVL